MNNHSKILPEDDSSTRFSYQTRIVQHTATWDYIAGHLLATLETLQKVYAFLPADARIIPGHGVAMSREDMKWHIDYLSAIKQQVQAAIAQGLTQEQTVKQVAMPEFRGYQLFDWVHPGLNVPAAYRDLSRK